MKEYLTKIVEQKREKKSTLEAKLTELREQIEKSEDVEEVKTLGETFDATETELNTATEELNEAEEKLSELDSEEKEPETEPVAEPVVEPTPVPVEGGIETKSAGISEKDITSSNEWEKVTRDNLTLLSSNETKGGDNMNENLEYRKKFMEAVQTRNVSLLEKRANEYTYTSDVEYVIPENLVNDIITEISNRGYIYNLVNKTSFAVGQTIPVGMVAIEASWVGDDDATKSQAERSGEGKGSDVQKGGVQGTIIFNNYKLRCVVGITHEAKIQSLEVFERKFIEQVADAMLAKIEDAIVNGNGVNKPKGILTETATHTVEIASGANMDYKDLVKFVGTIPARYRKGALIFATQNTFYKWLSITDTAGQPVARVNAGVDGEMRQYLFTTPVVFADEYLSDYADAPATDLTFGFAYNFKEYTLNTNYDLGITQRTVWENENQETKAVLACDGKAITKYSFVKYVKKAGTPSL